MFEKTTDPEVIALARAAFPDYRGRKFYRSEAETVNCRSYWDEGSKDWFVFVRTDTRATLPMPTSHPYFDRVDPAIERLPIPVGAVCVRRSVYGGKQGGLTVIFRKATALPS